MEFGPALDLMRAGCLMRRLSLSGSVRWVALRTGYPNGIAVNENTAVAFGMPVGTMVAIAPYFQAMTCEGFAVMWVPSHEDILAGDWVEVVR